MNDIFRSIASHSHQMAPAGYAVVLAVLAVAIENEIISNVVGQSQWLSHLEDNAVAVAKE